jgi:hypothetical protein
VGMAGSPWGKRENYKPEKGGPPKEPGAGRSDPDKTGAGRSDKSERSERSVGLTGRQQKKRGQARQQRIWG